MIKYVKGDILSPNTSDSIVLICHQVNCMGVMGAGLAKQVRTKYPWIYESYRKRCEEASLKSNLLGEVQFCSILPNTGYVIANVFGQETFGRDGKCYTDYDALRKAFAYIAETLLPQDVVRIPYKMGCGLGGGDWDVVLDIIDEAFRDKEVAVEIWERDNGKGKHAFN